MQRTLSAIAIAALVGGGVALAAQAQTPASPPTTPTTSPPAAAGRAPGMAPSMDQGQSAGAQRDMTGAQAANPSEDTIRQAQEQLKSLGLYRGTADGVMGPGTRTAIKRFQQKNSLAQTAELDPATLQQLTGHSAGSGSSTAPGQNDQPSSTVRQRMTPSAPGALPPTGPGK